MTLYMKMPLRDVHGTELRKDDLVQCCITGTKHRAQDSYPDGQLKCSNTVLWAHNTCLFIGPQQ